MDKILGPERDGLMGVVGAADKVVGIEQERRPVLDVLGSDGVQMVDVYSSEYWVTIRSKIQTHVSCDDVSSCSFPFRRGVEDLIEIAIVTERFLSNLAVQLEIVEPV